MSCPISFASEFPNDNPELHAGAIWICASPCAAATAELPRAIEVATAVAEVEVEVEAAAEVEGEDDEPIEDEVDEGDEDDDEIEIVDELDPIADDANDPFSVYIQTMTDVMIAAGGGDAAAHLVAALSEEPTAHAWRRIITGESEDFAACGAQSLDEWSAALVARLIAMPAKTDQLRRELRARGVAAFGLVVA